MEVTNREVQKVEDSLVVSENVKTVYTREMIWNEQQNLERDLYQLTVQSKELKADYMRRKQKLEELKEMLAMLEVEPENIFEELE